MASTSKEFNKTDIIKLAQSDPKLAEEVYHDSLAAPAYQAYATFQQNLKPIPKNGHTKMYDYVHFSDLKDMINKAMKGTGLSWHQVAHKGSIVTIPQLDNHGKPAFQVNYHKTHNVTSGYGRYQRTKQVPDPLIDQSGKEIPVYTKGQVVAVTTIITYANGYPLAHGSMSAVAQSTDPQDIGSAMTYCRRYSLSIATGASSTLDNDGQQSSGNSNVTSYDYRSNYNNNNWSNNRPKPQTISSSQVSTLKSLSDKVAKKYNTQPAKINNYLADIDGQSGAGLSGIYANKFNSAKRYLTSNI